MTFKCTLWPSGEVIEVDGERSLLEQLKKSGKKIKSSCGGCATCGDCVIIVKSGELNLNPQPFEETRLLGNVFHITKERLSCQTKVSGDVTIDISAHEKNSNSSKKTTGPVSKGSPFFRTHSSLFLAVPSHLRLVLSKLTSRKALSV
jgi:ferredoxin